MAAKETGSFFHFLKRLLDYWLFGVTVAFPGRPNQVSKEATREKDSAAEAKLLYELLIPLSASERAQSYLFGSNTLMYIVYQYITHAYHTMTSAQRVPEPDPLPDISFDTQPDPIQF